MALTPQELYDWARQSEANHNAAMRLVQESFPNWQAVGLDMDWGAAADAVPDTPNARGMTDAQWNAAAGGGQQRGSMAGGMEQERQVILNRLRAAQNQQALGQLSAEEGILGRNAPMRNQYEFARWANQAGQQNVNPFSLVAGNQLGSFLNYGQNLERDYESNTGPYGQLQHALTLQRPYRAEENVAATRADSDQEIARIRAAADRELALTRAATERGISMDKLHGIGRLADTLGQIVPSITDSLGGIFNRRPRRGLRQYAPNPAPAPTS